MLRDPTVPILAYHRIGVAPIGARHPDTYVHPGAFARQLVLLKALGYQAIAPEDYLRFRQGIALPMPRKPILISFDDGSQTVFSEALPLLKRHGFPAVVFMVSSQMGRPAIWDGDTEDFLHRQLTPAELRALRDEGWGIGSHTVTHSRLTDLGQDGVTRELADSKKYLESVVGRELTWFAYPYGDFSPEIRAVVGRAGYRLAFATENGDGEALSIPRRVISGRVGPIRFLCRLHQAGRLARRANGGASIPQMAGG